MKAVAIAVLSKELLRLGGAPVLDLFERELRGAVSLVTDTEFIARITSRRDADHIEQARAAANARTDAKLAYVAIDTGAQSKLFWIMSSSIAKSLATKEASGASAFPEMSRVRRHISRHARCGVRRSRRQHDGSG